MRGLAFLPALAGVLVGELDDSPEDDSSLEPGALDS
jgi:hypothetical protein